MYIHVPHVKLHILLEKIDFIPKIIKFLKFLYI
jgi:hypothetical protein